jgi:hypothetical protein
LLMIHSHWAYCPSGSIADHVWTMTGGVPLRELVRPCFVGPLIDSIKEPLDTAPRIRVLIADDHVMFRVAVQELVDLAPDLEVAGVARDGEEAWNMTLELNPVVLVLCGDMPLEVLSSLRHEMPRARLVLSTSDPGVAEIGRRFGADCVAKEALPSSLLAAIRGRT